MPPAPARVEADDVELEPPEPTLREQIESARDTVIDRQHADGEVSPPAEGERADGRVRDASGRFTRRDPEGNRQPSPEPPAPASGGGDRPAGQAAGAGDQPPPPAAVPPPPPDPNLPPTLNPELAPRGWTPKGQALWAQLPLEARQEIVRREYEAHRLASRMDEERQVARDFNQIAQAHQDVITRSGAHPMRLFQDFLGYMRVLGTGDPGSKAALLRDVALRNGVDPRAIIGLPPGAQSPPNAPPTGAAPPAGVPLVHPAVAKMVQEWNEFTTRQQQEAQQRELADQQRTLDEIIAFRSKPEARFFDAVKETMIGLLNAGAAGNIEEAYNAAIWARPDIRAILEKEQKDAAAAAEAKRLKALNARNKGVSVRGGSGSSPPAGGQDRSLREELQANFAEARGRV